MISLPTRIPRRWSFLLVALIALAVRAWTLVATEHDYYYAGLSLEAAETARNMLAGRGFGTDGSTGDLWEIQDTQLKLIDIEGYDTPGQPASSHAQRRYNLEGTYLSSFNRPWGYPALLAVTFALTGEERYLPSRILTLLLDVAAALVLMVIAGRFLPAGAALFAGISYAVFTPFAFLSTQPIWDAPMAPLMVFGLYFWVEALRAASDRRRLAMAALAGLMAGIGYQFRFEMLVYPLVLGGLSIFALSWRECVRLTGLAFVVTLLCTAPWAVRNYRLTGKPLLTGTPGIVWRNGLGEIPDNPWKLTMWDTDANAIALQHGFRNAMTPEASDLFMQQFFAAARSHPEWVAKTIARRVPYAITSYGWWTYGPHWARAMYHRPTDLGAETLRRVLQGAGAVVLLLAFFGLALVVRGRDWTALCLLAPAALVFATHVPTHWETRYSVPAFISYLLLAGWSVTWLQRKAAARGRAPEPG